MHMQWTFLFKCLYLGVISIFLNYFVELFNNELSHHDRLCTELIDGVRFVSHGQSRLEVSHLKELLYEAEDQ